MGAKEPEKKAKQQSAPSAAGAAPASAPRVDAKSMSASKRLFTTSLAVLAVAFGVGRLSSNVKLPTHSALDLLSHHARSLGASLATTFNAVPDKYSSSVVDMEVRVWAADECADTEYEPSLLRDGKLVHVTEPMEVSAMSSKELFFMLNGENEGLYVSWNGQFNCVARAAQQAAQWLGGDMDLARNGVRLYSQLGEPVRSAEELAKTRNIVHVLLDFQIWVWPGIKKGYKYTLDNGVTLTTVGLSPKVYDVEHFLTASEAAKVREYGEPLLDRSKVDGSNSSSVVSKSRTSHTAFLPDSAFTRAFRHRSARVARLPSPSFAERLQLVRYAAGEFYRQHLDTFHSREFLPAKNGIYTIDHFNEWVKWAAEKLDALDQSRVPEAFQKGGPLYPTVDDNRDFPNALLNVFYDHMNSSNLFVALSDKQWESWLRSNIDKGAVGIMDTLMKDTSKPHYLPMIIKAWERKIDIPELRYTMPKHPVNGVSHFYTWIRWLKERVAYLGTDVPPIARTYGSLYPRYSVPYQKKLLDMVLEDYSEEFITRLTNAEWFNWIMENKGHNNVLFNVMQVFPHFTEAVIRSWESRVNCRALHYKMPKYVKHFHPQRFVTLFLYLNNETKVGGETVFPFSVDRFNDEHIERKGMDECSQGLAVPPRGLHASLFYVQTPEGDIDYMSRHGGCPPHEGIKWGSNSFMWNADADEGANLWTTK